MKFEDLKAGDKVYIREDLEELCDYGGCVYIKAMKSGVKTVNKVFSDGTFKLKEIHGAFYYSLEMIDWEKTTVLNKTTINNIKPNHYKLNIKGIDLEVKDIMQEVMEEEQYKGFLYGNAIKYILRAYKKNGVEDLEKARKYIGWLIEQEDNNYGH